MKKITSTVIVFIMVFLMTACTNSGINTDTQNAANEVTEQAASEQSFDAQAAKARKEILQKYRSDKAVQQILIVTHTEGWNAKVFFYEKADVNDAWTLVFEDEAYIGKNGMGKTKEGDTKTPYGDYEVLQAFGILSNPGTSLEYIDVTPDTYACDEDCEFYNQIIDAKATGHNCKGEEMYKLCPEYNYGLTTSYNQTNKYPDGSAIFIHCKGQNPYTGGCIALDEEDMKTVVEKAEPGMRVYIDDYYKVK